MSNELINRLKEINRLMNYDRSKTLFEQKNNPEIDDKGNNINPNASYYGTTDKLTPHERYIVDSLYGGDVEAYRKHMRQRDDFFSQEQEKDRISYQDNLRPNLYNPQIDIDNRMGKDERLKFNRFSNTYGPGLIYQEGDKPTEPVVVKGEGHYVDENGKTQNPNGYWRVTYNSPRYKSYFKNIIQPILNGQMGSVHGMLLSGEYKDEVWRIYRQDLDEWDCVSQEQCPPEYQEGSSYGWLHVFLPLAAVLVGVATGGVGGIILAGMLEAADAYLYYKEGDTASAALTTIFMFIPGAILVSRIPGVKNLIKETGERGISNLLKKVRDGLPLNAAERRAVNEISKQQDELYKLAVRYSNIVEKSTALMKMGLRGTVILLLHLARLPIFTLKWTIRIGGVLFAGNELLYRLTQYYDIKWEEHWGPKPTLTEEQLAVSDEVLVKECEEELNERATGQVKTINESEESVIIQVDSVLNSFDVNQYVIN